LEEQNPKIDPKLLQAKKQKKGNEVVEDEPEEPPVVQYMCYYPHVILFSKLVIK
jgi:hypothetical protein